MKKFIFLCIIGACIVSIIFLWCFVVILPTESSSHKLTLVHYGGPFMRTITLKQVINGEYIKSYILDLKCEPRYQEPQEYEIPQMKEGGVEVVVECSYGEIFDVYYQNAIDLYKNGLLIYGTLDDSTTIEINGVVDYDLYMHFRSGQNKTSFLQKAGVSEWSIIENPPQLKKFTREWMGYSPIFDVWREDNKWRVEVIDK